MEELGAELYMKARVGSHFAHIALDPTTYALRAISRVWFCCSVCLLCWGWCKVDRRTLSFRCSTMEAQNDLAQ